MNLNSTQIFDIAVLGGGISGFSGALRLQKRGFNTIVFESHTQIGGCAGFFIKKKFSFDVGATTLVDFVEGGVGGNFFDDIGLPLPPGEYLDYIAWLPDRHIVLFRDKQKWGRERLEKLGNTENHIRFWKLMDVVTDVFWKATRKNIQLPINNFKNFIKSLNAIGLKNVFLVKYYNKTMMDVLKSFHLEKDKPLVGLLSMLIEDTVHSTIEHAPFINSALGATIRGAGLMRAKGGMKEFWKYISEHYKNLGGEIKRSHRVISFEKDGSNWKISTNKGIFYAKKIINSIPLENIYDLSPEFLKEKLANYISQNKNLKGGAIVVFLGVPESEVANQILTHHQILIDYNSRLGNGNNMFISISKKDDILSAPSGFRAVMISTHCELDEWQNLSESEYQSKKKKIGDKLINYARKVYPELGKNPIVYEIGTPMTYQKYTGRKIGSVGGFKQTLSNSNSHSVPHDINVSNFWLTGDNTWPGLGTVAGLISGRIAAEYASK
ncbi:MAG: FAD-dependent oxidoreductase [Leptospiraceae bacterium]|nr:FAD-dependent oxidoreductase [Leptospiraceae bacterium]